MVYYSNMISALTDVVCVSFTVFSFPPGNLITRCSQDQNYIQLLCNGFNGFTNTCNLITQLVDSYKTMTVNIHKSFQFSYSSCMNSKVRNVCLAMNYIHRQVSVFTLAFNLTMDQSQHNAQQAVCNKQLYQYVPKVSDSFTLVFSDTAT